MELIKKAALLKAMRDYWGENPATIRMINEQPAIDAVEVRRGEWQRKQYEEAETLAICSKCNYPISWWHKTPYCPSCGARMDGHKKEGL